jgi:methyl-accepting chemotaxis protein
VLFASNQDIAMRLRITLFIATLILAVAPAPPAWAVSKEIIQLQTQVQQLQDQMARMQQSFDERMGVMQHLIEQTTDSMNKVNATIGDLQRGLSQQHGDVAARNDQLSGQIQSLNDSVDELKARLARVSKQLDDMVACAITTPTSWTLPARSLLTT